MHTQDVETAAQEDEAGPMRKLSARSSNCSTRACAPPLRKMAAILFFTAIGTVWYRYICAVPVQAAPARRPRSSTVLKICSDITSPRHRGAGGDVIKRGPMTQSAEPKSAKHEPLDAAALERIFLAGRTHNAWQNKPVAPALLTQIYDLMKMARPAQIALRRGWFSLPRRKARRSCCRILWKITGRKPKRHLSA